MLVMFTIRGMSCGLPSVRDDLEFMLKNYKLGKYPKSSSDRKRCEKILSNYRNGESDRANSITESSTDSSTEEEKKTMFTNPVGAEFDARPEPDARPESDARPEPDTRPEQIDSGSEDSVDLEKMGPSSNPLTDTRIMTSQVPSRDTDVEDKQKESELGPLEQPRQDASSGDNHSTTDLEETKPVPVEADNSSIASPQVPTVELDQNLESSSESEPASEPQPDALPVHDVPPEPINSELDMRPEPEPESVPELMSVSEPQLDARPEDDMRPESVPEPQPHLDARPEPVNSELDMRPEPQPEPGFQPNAVPEDPEDECNTLLLNWRPEQDFLPLDFDEPDVITNVNDRFEEWSDPETITEEDNLIRMFEMLCPSQPVEPLPIPTIPEPEPKPKPKSVSESESEPRHKPEGPWPQPLSSSLPPVSRPIDLSPVKIPSLGCKCVFCVFTVARPVKAYVVVILVLLMLCCVAGFVTCGVWIAKIN